MGLELNIAKELANICVTVTELRSIETIILSEIKNEDFTRQFQSVTENLVRCYDIVVDNLSPLAELNSENAFVSHFDDYLAHYKNNYLQWTGQPRNFSEQAYENYLVLQTYKQTKTSYPLLKTAFARFDEFIDKWVTNDAWLAMSIENLLKILPRQLAETAKTKQQAVEDAFLLHTAVFSAIAPYLSLIQQQKQHLSATAKETAST